MDLLWRGAHSRVSDHDRKPAALSGEAAIWDVRPGGALTDVDQPMDPGLAGKFKEYHASLERSGKVGSIAQDSGIPLLFAKGQTLPEAWENSLVCLWAGGCSIRTQYDEKDGEGNYLFPPSKDCTMIMAVEEPLSEPFIHRCFPGGLEDLEEYRQEVLEGIKDHWVRNPDDPADRRWEYTYHERMFRYSLPGVKDAVDQFEQMAQNIARNPVTRRAQMVSWKPWEDNAVSDPPCWQSYWGRLSADERGTLVLNVNMRFRSRDAYKAAFMNDYAFILLAKKLAARVGEIRGEEVRVGRFVDQSDSYHIYGSYFKEFAGTFVKQLLTRDFSQRTWRSDDPVAVESIAEAKEAIAEKIRKVDRERA